MLDSLFNSLRRRLRVAGRRVLATCKRLLNNLKSLLDARRRLWLNIQCLFSKNADTYYCRGLACLEQGKYQEAIADFRKALEIDKGHEKAYNYLEIAHIKLRDSPKSNSGQLQLEQGKPELQQRLLRLLNFERETANRLLAKVKHKYPDRSIDWYFEKAIRDLERDRQI